MSDTEDEADVARAQQDAQRVAHDVERVDKDEQRVEHDVERVSQDVDERLVQDTNRAKQDTIRAEQDQVRTDQDALRGEADDIRDRYDDAIAIGIGALTAQAERLAGTVADLNARITTSEDTQTNLAKALKHNTSQETFNKAMLVVASAFVLYAVIMGFVIYRVDTNANKIADLQTRTSDKVLCPLYSVFVASMDNAGPLAGDSNRDGKVTPAERERYENAVRVIREGYGILECKPPLKS